MISQKLTTANIKILKDRRKIVCLTCYSYNVAKIIDDHCDIILVGDSLGMVVYGMKDTVDVTMDMMINHGKAVTNGAKKALIVVDMPYGSYENDKNLALTNAQRIIRETGCDAVKIEIDDSTLPILKHLTDNNVEVMGHIGLLPQHVRKIGGYKYQATDENSRKNIINLANKVAEFKAFSLVIEAVPKKVADEISQISKIPTIGIGASNQCHGQILVIDDMLGLNKDFKPKFVKTYEDLGKVISNAVLQYKSEVITQDFPAAENMLDKN